MMPFIWGYDTLYFRVPYPYFGLEFKSQNSKAADLVGVAGGAVLNVGVKVF
jgi:hypothetical protein